MTWKIWQDSPEYGCDDNPSYKWFAQEYASNGHSVREALVFDTEEDARRAAGEAVEARQGLPATPVAGDAPKPASKPPIVCHEDHSPGANLVVTVLLRSFGDTFGVAKVYGNRIEVWRNGLFLGNSATLDKAHKKAARAYYRELASRR